MTKKTEKRKLEDDLIRGLTDGVEFENGRKNFLNDEGRNKQ